jgi:hypothetical protein
MFSTSESLHDLSHIDFCWQSTMVHGFQLFDIWQHHLMESGADFLDLQKSYKQAAGDKLLFPHPDKLMSLVTTVN